MDYKNRDPSTEALTRTIQTYNPLTPRKTKITTPDLGVFKLVSKNWSISVPADLTFRRILTI